MRKQIYKKKDKKVFFWKKTTKLDCFCGIKTRKQDFLIKFSMKKN